MRDPTLVVCDLCITYVMIRCEGDGENGKECGSRWASLGCL